MFSRKSMDIWNLVGLNLAILIFHVKAQKLEIPQI